jgi:2-desacetyl-2-hydroxyethyl bacteriochlorophyllide A dehydrogenase
MKTITLEEPGRFTASDAPEPAYPAPREALVQVSPSGGCGTDLHAYRGRQPFFTYPRILGHELGVEVLEVNDGGESGIRAGDRCAVDCCVSLKVLGVHTDGGMRERITVPVNKLHTSNSLSLDQLALVETLGIGAHAVDRAAITPGDRALIIGAGPIGLAVAQFALQAKAEVTVMDVNESRLGFCREAIGVASTVFGDDDALSRIKKMTSGDLPTVVFDATGNPESMHRAFQFVSHGGRLVFVGLFQGDVTFHDPHFHRREMTILSSRNSTPADFKRIIRLIESGEIDTTPWITHRCALDGIIPEFPSWLLPETAVLKAIVEI